jgi:hypothetical protein
MSFGFKVSVSEIRSAILYASSRDVIMFAAASNEGGNLGISWPARLPEVIYIHATDGKGNKGPFTPDTLSNADNFSLLGVNVESCWPSHLKQGPTRRKSGTSCSTAIAAGIAVLILEISGLHIAGQSEITPEDLAHWQKLRSAGGMRKAFQQMCRDRDGYNYIRPSRLFRLGEKPEVAMWLSLRELVTNL